MDCPTKTKLAKEKQAHPAYECHRQTGRFVLKSRTALKRIIDTLIAPNGTTKTTSKKRKNQSRQKTSTKSKKRRVR